MHWNTDKPVEPLLSCMLGDKRAAGWEINGQRFAKAWIPNWAQRGFASVELEHQKAKLTGL